MTARTWFCLLAKMVGLYVYGSFLWVRRQLILAVVDHIKWSLRWFPPKH